MRKNVMKYIEKMNEWITIEIDRRTVQLKSYMTGGKEYEKDCENVAYCNRNIGISSSGIC